MSLFFKGKLVCKSCLIKQEKMMDRHEAVDFNLEKYSYFIRYFRKQADTE
jgi:hypothetical protein